MIELINAAWKVEGLTPAEKLVLLRLADRASTDGRCYPGQASLARECCLTTRSVSRATKTLLNLGHLTIEQESTFRMARVYSVTPKVQTGDKSSPPDNLSPPDTVSPEGRQNVGRGPDTMSPGVLTPCQPNHQGTTKEPPRTTTAGESGELLTLEPDQVKSKPDPKTSFDEFWKVWPKKDNKKKAFAVWKRVNPDSELLAVILADVVKRTAAFDWKNTPHRFFPGPEPYLNGERWKDQGVILPGASKSPMASSDRSALESERARIVCLLPVHRTRAQVARLAEIDAALGSKEAQS